MSRVIKKSVELDDVVAVGRPQGADRSKEQVKKSAKVSLDFKGGIDSAIEKWRGEIEEHVAINNKIEEAFQSGYEKGFNEGLDKEYADRENYIDKHFSDRIKVIESLLNEAKRTKEKAFRGLEEKIIKLAVNIAEKIINKSIKADTKIIETTVTETMSRIVSSETIILKVSAEDYKYINSKYDKWLGMAGNVKEFRIEIDKRLSSGDCLIETEGGIIDASLSSRLDILTDELLKIDN